METKFKFEKLRIWEKSMDFGESIHSLALGFPNTELYNLSSQIRRAADSIALNIAEGSIGQSNREFTKFINYSMRSLAEVITCLHKAKRRKYIDYEKFGTLYEDAFSLMNMMAAFRKTLD